MITINFTKAFDQVNTFKLIKILKNIKLNQTIIHWRQVVARVEEQFIQLNLAALDKIKWYN